MAACDRDDEGCLWTILPVVLGPLAALVLVCPMMYWPLRWSEDSHKYPEYTVAISGFSGLDDVLARPTLDPTFDLTVRIREPRRWSAECVPRGTTSFVSYQGVALARGPVPKFCGEKLNATVARSVMAWGYAMPVPRFARERLAEELRRGDAAVDVALRKPGMQVVECKVALGRGEPSPGSTVTYEYSTFPDDPASRIRPPRPRRKILKSPQSLAPAISPEGTSAAA